MSDKDLDSENLNNINDEDSIYNEELEESNSDNLDDSNNLNDSDDIDIMFKFNTNNHKIEGKHSLKRDTIFKGKVEDENVEFKEIYSSEDYTQTLNDGFPIETGSLYELESRYNDEYVNRLDLSNDIYNLLKENTNLDFSSNRRKPNRQAFNDYYRMLLNNLGKKYSKSEIFVELSYYFTDNIFNMFKLLDKTYATQIIFELKKNGYLDNLNNINFI